MQDISETFFADGLLSCGSDACVATYATCLQRGLVGDVAGGVTLFNMALFYAPSPAVVKKIFVSKAFFFVRFYVLFIFRVGITGSATEAISRLAL